MCDCDSISAYDDGFAAGFMRREREFANWPLPIWREKPRIRVKMGREVIK
jgi:hypothetical protein